MSGQPSYLGVVTAGWVAALKNSDSLERRLAAHALAEIGRMAPEAVAPLTQALRDSESFVRVWAAAALARVEPKHPDVIPALVRRILRRLGRPTRRIKIPIVGLA